MDHYYTTRPDTISRPETWQYELLGYTFTFTTDHGVFSRNTVDFGSRLLMEHFQEPEQDGMILDLGCGYGPIGIALARKYPDRDFLLSDVNERALHLARENVMQNHITNISIQPSDRLSGLSTSHFAAIVTNPPIRAGKDVVFDMYREGQEQMHPGGELWVVIQKKQGAPSTKKELERLFPSVRLVARKKGYHIFRATK